MPLFPSIFYAIEMGMRPAGPGMDAWHWHGSTAQHNNRPDSKVAGALE
jgi:hypothetical protein